MDMTTNKLAADSAASGAEPQLPNRCSWSTGCAPISTCGTAW